MKLPILRTRTVTLFATQPARRFPLIQPLSQSQTRLASAGPSGSGTKGPDPETGAPGDKVDRGTAKEYNKDGTNPNKKFVYLGLGVLGVGAVYSMYGSRAEKMPPRGGSP